MAGVALLVLSVCSRRMDIKMAAPPEKEIWLLVEWPESELRSLPDTSSAICLRITLFDD